MSKWVSVLAASFMTLALLLAVLAPFIFGELVGVRHLFVVPIFLCSAWWLVKTIRTPAAEEEIPSHGEPEVVPPLETALLLLGVLAIFP